VSGSGVSGSAASGSGVSGSGVSGLSFSDTVSGTFPPVFVDHFDLIPPAALPVPRLVIQLGDEPVAAAWPSWLAQLAAAGCARWVLAGPRWHDPESSAQSVVLGDIAAAVDGLASALAAAMPAPRDGEAPAIWRELEDCAARATARSIDAHPRSETAMLRAALGAVPAGAAIQLGNSLPIRVADQLPGGGAARVVLTQRGAAGIDGLIASAAGATWAGQPVLLVLGDVSFAHDLGGLLAARAARAPLAILVVDNRGGQIFAGLPIARAHQGAAFDRHWLTAPELDPAAVAAAVGVAATTAVSPAAAATAIAHALAAPGVTVIHAPVTASGAHDVRRAAIAEFPAHRGHDHELEPDLDLASPGARSKP
jgi:2-succinyl-5-enolpyruvyl-6-hydroxy-3-cyclohexene-1-carboxylate synthase